MKDLFRKEYAHLVSALTRVLGPSGIPPAEDVVRDALVSSSPWRTRTGAAGTGRAPSAA